MADNKYGLLLNPEASIYREYFKEMASLLGINCQYRSPIDASKIYDTNGFLDANYRPPITVSCIFEERPKMKTLKKLGWAAELDTASPIISVPYDLPYLQKGALFTIPSGFENTPGRTFRVIEISAELIYPASLTCKLALEYENKDPKNLTTDFATSTGNVLLDNEGDD